MITLSLLNSNSFLYLMGSLKMLPTYRKKIKDSEGFTISKPVKIKCIKLNMTNFRLRSYIWECDFCVWCFIQVLLVLEAGIISWPPWFPGKAYHIFLFFIVSICTSVYNIFFFVHHTLLKFFPFSHGKLTSHGR